MIDFKNVETKIEIVVKVTFQDFNNNYNYNNFSKQNEISNIIYCREHNVYDVDDHELQKGEVLSLVNCWLDIHRPDCVEVYEDNTNPEYYYGPQRITAMFATAEEYFKTFKDKTDEII